MFELAFRARSRPASDRPFDLFEALLRPSSERPPERLDALPTPRSTPTPAGGPPPCPLPPPLPPPPPRPLPCAKAPVANSRTSTHNDAVKAPFRTNLFIFTAP